MYIEDVINFLKDENISFNKDIDLRQKTWIKRGGKASVWTLPDNISVFEKLINWCQLNKVKFEVIGNTSNCYFLNNYNPGLVISTLKLNNMIHDKNSIICDCGYNMSKLSKYCIRKGISGFEGFIGLPGTVGGAIINNAGCYGSLVSDIVKNVIIIRNGNKELLTNEQLHYSHRNSVLKSKIIDGVVHSVIFKIDRRDSVDILEKRALEFQFHRRSFQEQTYPNLGSTFSIIQLKKYSFFLKCLNALIYRFLNLTIRDQVKRQKLKTRITLIFRKAGKLRRYISDFGIGCFTWKDDKADQVFFQYLDFIERISVKSVIEIDIKRDTR